jgi:hypothetical protein
MANVVTALMDTLGPVSPVMAALWLASTIVLAGLLVAIWQRLLQR